MHKLTNLIVIMILQSIHIIKSSCCTLKTYTTLYVNYISIKLEKKSLKQKIRYFLYPKNFLHALLY